MNCKVCSKELKDKYKDGVDICYDCNSGWIIKGDEKEESERLWVDFVKFKGWDIKTIPHNALYMKELGAYILGRVKRGQ